MLNNADLIAPEGFVYTDGKDVFAKKIWLGDGKTKDDFHLISKEEYDKLMEAETEDSL